MCPFKDFQSYLKSQPLVPSIKPHAFLPNNPCLVDQLLSYIVQSLTYSWGCFYVKALERSGWWSLNVQSKRALTAVIWCVLGSSTGPGIVWSIRLKDSLCVLLAHRLVQDKSDRSALRSDSAYSSTGWLRLLCRTGWSILNLLIVLRSVQELSN